MFKIKDFFLYLTIPVLVTIWCMGCYPDRFPVSPEEYETRRPQVGFVKPAYGDTVHIDTLNTMQIWFDELMDHQTILSTVSLSLATSDEPWTNLDYINAVDQSQTESNILFASRDRQGSFYSEDNGLNWIFIKGLAEYQINFIKIDPANSSVIYAASDSTILKSTDGGQAWKVISQNLPADIIIWTLAFDPLTSERVWLGTSNGVFQSNDAALTWNAAATLPAWTNQEISRISVDPKNTSIIYVSTLGRFIYKSIDDGNSWEMKRGVTDQLGTSRIYAVIVDPDSSNILYAASINQGVYKSSDAAENWLRANNGIDDLNARILNIHLADANRLYMATGQNVYYSFDKAISWQKISFPEGGSVKSVFGNAQNASTIYVATSSAIHKSENRGENWDEISSIDISSIQARGNFTFSIWQDTLEFVIFDIEGRPDTLKISPYRYDDALAAYDAGLISAPPVEPNPTATKVEFSPDEKLFRNWQYRLMIRGAFEGNNWRGDYGASDLNGMSVQYDFISQFLTK